MTRELDILAPEERVSLTLRELYERYGYKKYRMGQFEEYGLYMEHKNFLSSENVIAFTDLDGRLMALKPDVTLSIVRHAAKEPALPEKLYYMESVYRPSAESHTFREISQMGLEYIGAIDGYAVAEVAVLAAKSLSQVGPTYLLEMSHMGFGVALLDALGLTDGLRTRALTALEQKNASALASVATEAGLSEADAGALTVLPALYGPFRPTLERARRLCRGAEMDRALDELEQVYAAAEAVGYADRLQLDFSLLGATDYYNGILFRGYLEGLPRPVLVGGRYDGILRKLGKAGGGVGFALQLSELSRLPVKRREADVDLLLRYGPDTDPVLVMKAVAEAAAQGLRVRALAECENAGELRVGKTRRVTGEGGAEPC